MTILPFKNEGFHIFLSLKKFRHQNLKYNTSTTQLNGDASLPKMLPAFQY